MPVNLDENPLVNEVKAVVEAVERIPESPERNEALVIASRALVYTKVKVTDYENRLKHYEHSFTSVGQKAKEIVSSWFHLDKSKENKE